MQDKHNVHVMLGGAFPKRHHVDCGLIAIICKVPVLGRHKEPVFFWVLVWSVHTTEHEELQHRYLEGCNTNQLRHNIHVSELYRANS
jgi:hypothetical protein